jgi:hypothetical protein
MRYALLALVVLGLAPVAAEAGHRDRDSRWSVSVGFGYSDYGWRGGDYFDTRIRYSERYDRGWDCYPRYSRVSDCPPRYYYRETYYCPPPVVYRPAPVYVAPPPVVYYPAPVYRYDCYPRGGYGYYRSTSYYYGR